MPYECVEVDFLRFYFDCLQFFSKYDNCVFVKFVEAVHNFEFVCGAAFKSDDYYLLVRRSTVLILFGLFSLL